MLSRLVVFLGLYGCSHGWWQQVEPPDPPKAPKWWKSVEDTFPRVSEYATSWYQWSTEQYDDFTTAYNSVDPGKFEFSLWMILDAVVSFLGWAVFGQAWTSVKSGCRRLVQMLIVVFVCLAAHYVWAVCCPIVSIIVAMLMALIWVLRRIVKVVGTTFFYMQRLAGGVPEAADVEFVGPATGITPETAVLRTMKRSGDQPKQLVVRRGNEVATFFVGSEAQSIRGHGLYVTVEPDTLRGHGPLVQELNRQDRIHLCRHSACCEEGGMHFTEYAAVKKFNPERFQMAQSQSEARSLSKKVWNYLFPDPAATASKMMSTLRAAYGSESESENLCCQADKVGWTTDEGQELLADTKCTANGVEFHQVLEEDRPPTGSKVVLCSKHTSHYLVKRHPHKCGVVGCLKHGCNFSSSVRWCQQHTPAPAAEPERKPSRSSRSRSRSRPKVRPAEEEEEVFPEEEDPDDEEEDEEPPPRRQARRLLRGASEGGRDSKVRRTIEKSPGNTPKSSIQRNLAKLGMLSSPSSEAPEVKVLEEFMELFAQGSEKGLKEGEIRSRIARERLMSEEEVLKRLLHEADLEQAKGQRGLSRFLVKWRKEADRIAVQESSRTPSDWSVVGQEPGPSTPGSVGLRAVPPIPSVFQATGEEARLTTSPTVPEEPKQEVKEKPKIAAPGIYRPDRKAGATGSEMPHPEPVEQIAKALQNQTAELATLVRHQAEGAETQPTGTLKGLTKQSEEVVFMLRACGQYAIKLGEGEHGQALAGSLLAAQVGASTKLRLAGFRQRMTQRLAIGLAGAHWGSHEKYCLSAADFVSYTDAELDSFASEARGSKVNSDQRPQAPARFDEWVARVRRQTDCWCLVYGEEWRAVRNHALEKLSEWHLAYPHRWPYNVICDVWEEIHWRIIEDVKDLVRKLKKEVGRETMTLAEIKFHALLPGPDGQAWLEIPSTFDLERPDGWFQTEVIPRIERKQDRLLWNLTWQGPKRDRPQGATSTSAGAVQEPEKPSLKALWGPKLNPEEVNRAKERAPLKANSYAGATWPTLDAPPKDARGHMKDYGDLLRVWTHVFKCSCSNVEDSSAWSWRPRIRLRQRLKTYGRSLRRTRRRRSRMANVVVKKQDRQKPMERLRRKRLRAPKQGAVEKKERYVFGTSRRSSRSTTQRKRTSKTWFRNLPTLGVKLVMNPNRHTLVDTVRVPLKRRGDWSPPHNSSETMMPSRSFLELQMTCMPGLQQGSPGSPLWTTPPCSTRWLRLDWESWPKRHQTCWNTPGSIVLALLDLRSTPRFGTGMGQVMEKWRLEEKDGRCGITRKRCQCPRNWHPCWTLSLLF